MPADPDGTQPTSAQDRDAAATRMPARSSPELVRHEAAPAAPDPLLDLGASISRIVSTAQQEAERLLATARAEAAALRQAAEEERGAVLKEAAALREQVQNECQRLLTAAQRKADELVERGKQQLSALEAGRAELERHLNEVEATARALRLRIQQEGSPSGPAPASPRPSGPSPVGAQPSPPPRVDPVPSSGAGAASKPTPPS